MWIVTVDEHRFVNRTMNINQLVLVLRVSYLRAERRGASVDHLQAAPTANNRHGSDSGIGSRHRGPAHSSLC